MGIKILIACEFSGVVRDAFRRKGYKAWSCDILDPLGDYREFHFKCDVRALLHGMDFDLMIAHPPCTRLANSGVRWLHSPPGDRTFDEMWKELYEGVSFYNEIKNSSIPRKAIENPIMHKYAKAMTSTEKRQIIQPWWFGEESFKATGFELIGLPELKPTNILTPPKKGTLECFC